MLERLKDFYGNRVKNINEKQSDEASVAALIERIGTHPTNGLTPQRLATTFREAEAGNIMAQCDLAEDMEEKDGHVFAELSKRKRCLLGADWDIKPPRNATDAEIADAQLIKDLLEDAGWLDDVILDMADAILKGFSNCELEWGRIGGNHVPLQVHHRDAGWFMLNPKNRDQILLRNNDKIDGEPLKPFGWISHVHKAKSGYIGRAGLVRCLAWPFLFKNLSIRDLAEFLEIYGLPVKIGKYPSGANDKEKRSLLRAITSIGHRAGGIIPHGMEIDFEAAAAGTPDAFMSMVDWCERTQSKAILGGTLTSQADGKSSTNALGNVHNEVRAELRESDLKQIAATLTRDVVFPMFALNGLSFSGKDRIPRFEFDLTQPEDLGTWALNLPRLVRVGMRIPLSYAHDKLQIPIADDTEEVLMIQSNEEGNEEKLKALTAALKQGAPDVTDKQAQGLEKSTGDLMDGWVEKIRALVDEVDSLEEISQRLLELMPDMDETQFADAIAEAMMAAQLAGRYDIIEGN